VTTPARATDRAAGAVTGAVDAARGFRHESHSWSTEPASPERAAAAQARWESGLPARNAYERAAYAAIDATVIEPRTDPAKGPGRDPNPGLELEPEAEA